MFKKTNLFMVITALAGIMAQSMQAIPYRGEILRKQRKDGTYQTVYCLHDIHPKTSFPQLTQMGYTDSEKSAYIKRVQGLDPVIQEHKQALYDTLLNKFSKNKVKVLVEDMTSDPHGRTIKFPGATLGKILSRGFHAEFLGGITQNCISKGIPVKNLECRHNVNFMSTYLGLMNDNFCHFPTKEIMLYKRSASDLNAETNEALREITSCVIHNNDLNTYNTLHVKLYKMNRKLDLSKLGESPIGLIKSAILLDLKAINHIYTSLDTEQDIVLLMGSIHIEHIANVLTALLDYEKVYETGSFLMSSVIGTTSNEHKKLDEYMLNQAEKFDVTKFFDVDITHSNNAYKPVFSSKEELLSNLEEFVKAKEKDFNAQNALLVKNEIKKRISHYK